MRARKRKSAFIVICLLFSLLLMPLQNVSAVTENDAVLDARRGIVQVMFAAENSNKELVDLYGGTGFLIGVEEEGAQYVITNHHVVDPFQPEYVDNLETEQNAVWDYLGIPHDQEIKTQIRIVLKRDTYINAEIIESSKSTDFAILKLEQPIYGDRKPLVLADSDNLKETEDVYALGFPATVQAMQNAQLYTSSDVNINDGKISKLADSVLIDDPIPCINHSATITDGNSGGPLVNSNGEVVGVNRHTDAAGKYFYSVQINEIAEVLDLRGIEYEKAGDSAVDAEPEETPEVTPETTETVETDGSQIGEVEDNSALFAELESLIDEVSDIDLTKMEEATVENFEEALEEAKNVLDNADSTAEDLEDAIDDLENARDGLLEKSSGISTAVIIVIAVIAIVVIIVVVVLIITSSNKKKRIQAEKERQKRVAATMQSQQPINPAGGQSQWNQQRPPVSPMPMMNDGSEETGVLNDGSSETTVLGGGHNMPTAYLVRKKNNERVTISKPIFKLGKERRKVDYCIADNTNVSRTHADIIFRNGEFFVIDNNATNGTSVNGATVAAGQERRLMNNDTVKLADEEFQFRTF